MSYRFRFVRLRDSGVAADAAGIGGGGAEDLLRGKVAVNGGDDRELADPSLFSNLAIIDEIQRGYMKLKNQKTQQINLRNLIQVQRT